jgi:peptidyl-prolyl cis-trans isomerase D
MLTAFRRFSKSWIAVVLFVLLIASFAVFGISDVFTGRMDNWVVKAGDRTIGSIEFKRRFDLQRRQLEEQNGPIPLEMAAANGLDRQVLAAVASQEALSAMIERAGIRISDAALAAELRKNTSLFNQVTGQFDQEIYTARLQEQGLTPAVYEGFIRDEKAAQQLVSALAFGLRAPRISTAWIGAYALEERDVSLFMLDQNMVPRPAAATEAELEAFLKANAARFTRPELRTLTVVTFDPAAVTAPATIDPAEVRKRFDFRKETLAKPEARTFVQISAADAAQATTISQRLNKGEEPLAVALALKRPITTLADRPRSAIPDARLAQAVFSLTPGQASGPVDAQLGYVVVKLTGVTPGVEADFDTVRPQIEAEIRAQAIQDQLDAQIEAYETAHTAGMNLPAAAAKAGAKLTTIGPVSAQGTGETGQPVAGANPTVLKTAFEIPVGSDSDVQDAAAAGGMAYAVRVERSIPPLLPKVVEIRPLLEQLVAARKTMEALTARAEALRERVAKGEPISAVAAAAGAQVATIRGMTRLRASQDPSVAQSMPQDLLEHMFEEKPGSAFIADAGPPRVIVAKLDAVRNGQLNEMARIIESQRPQLTAQIFRDMQEQVQSRAATAMKARTDLARARTAIGVDPDMAARIDGKPAPKG